MKNGHTAIESNLTSVYILPVRQYIALTGNIQPSFSMINTFVNKICKVTTHQFGYK